MKNGTVVVSWSYVSPARAFNEKLYLRFPNTIES